MKKISIKITTISSKSIFYENTDEYVHKHIITRGVNENVNTYLEPVKVSKNAPACFLNAEAQVSTTFLSGSKMTLWQLAQASLVPEAAA